MGLIRFVGVQNAPQNPLKHTEGKLYPGSPGGCRIESRGKHVPNSFPFGKRKLLILIVATLHNFYIQASCMLFASRIGHAPQHAFLNTVVQQRRPVQTSITLCFLHSVLVHRYVKSSKGLKEIPNSGQLRLNVRFQHTIQDEDGMKLLEAVSRRCTRKKCWERFNILLVSTNLSISHLNQSAKQQI